jgi:EpsD family peptidyl-prolyl cis-trans isomerase
MNSSLNRLSPSANSLSVKRSLIVATGCLALVLVACGGGNKKDKPASQVAAKVNKEEISVHQINFVLQQQRGLKPEQADVASRQVLERLIDQELAVQKAQELKIDRDPRVMQQIEAAKREIVARAYIEKTGEAAPKPTTEEVAKYYAEKPGLFKDRRIYSIQEIAIEAKPEQVEMLRGKLQAAKSVNEFIEYLKANNIRFAGNQAVRPAEQLPLNMLDTFAKMKDGQAMLVPSANGAQVIVLAGSKTEPVDETRAKPAIEQFLLNDAKRKLIESDVKGMRTAAKIEYVGKFAEGGAAAAAAAAKATEDAAAASMKPTTGALGTDAINKGLNLKGGATSGSAPAAPVAVMPPPAAGPAGNSPIADDVLSKGLGGKGGSTKSTTPAPAPAVAMPAGPPASGPLNQDVISKGLGVKK